MGRFHFADWRFALALLVAGAGGAEALTYSWKPSVSTYSPVTGTPLTFSSTDNGAVVLSLPFSFIYDSLTFTTAGVNSNGMVVLGSVNNTSFSNADLFGSFSPYNVLAPWWDDLVDDATGTVQSFTEGSAPNRVFVIQYGDYPDYATGSVRLNWQVRLHEGSNRIQFVYGNKGAGTPSPNSSASVGIKGRNSVAGFYINGTTGSRTVPNAALNSNTGFPAAGTVFTFAPDTAAPLGLTAAPGSGRADLTWGRTRLASLLRYRIWIGTSPTTMTPRDSTTSRNDTTFSLTGLVNGAPYYVGVSVVGPGLEESGFAQVVAVTPSQPPTVSIASPASGTVLASNGSITFTASASDADGSIARVEYYRGGTILLGSSTLGSGYAITWSPLVTGIHSITARAYDNFGTVTTSAPITVVVNALPAVSLTAPTTGSVLAPGADITLTATASDADGSVARVEFLRDGVLLGSDATAPFAYAWTSVPAGRYTLTARAVDDRGASTVSTSSILIVTQPPTVTVTAPAAGSVVNSTAGTITLSADALDADGTVARVDFYRGTTLVGTSTSGNPFTVNATAVSGTWNLTARATDNLGAIGTSATVTFTVNLSPSVSLTAPTAGAYPLGSAISLSASASDAEGTVRLVEFFRDGVKLGEDNSSPFSLSWTPDSAGRYALTVRATDNAGGSTTSATTWVTLSRPPTVRFNSPANGFIRFPTDSLTVTASDPDGTVSRVEYYNGSTLIGSSTTGNSYRFTWNLPNRGTFHLTARAYDNSGLASAPDFITVSTTHVRLTSPTHFSAFATHSSISLTAKAWPLLATGSITRVDFYRDSVLIGSSTGPGPDFATTWSNVPAGRYRLQARSVDNRDSIGYSQPVTVFVNDSAKAIQGGKVFITGHDADLHQNVEFISAGLNYLTLGHSPSRSELPICAGVRIAFLGNNPPPALAFANYPSVTFIDLDNSNWDSLAFDGLHYDIIIVGTFSYYVTAAGSTALNLRRSRFDQYFNKGGGIFAMSEYYHGPTYYNFLPAFGTARGQNIGQVQGRFTATPPGLSIGLTESVVDRDLTHTEFLDVSNVFQIFEIFNDDMQAVSIGANAIIEDGGFIPADTVTAPPVALARDTVFADTLCVSFSTPSPGASIHITANGGNPDTSTWVLTNGGMVCIDKSTTFRAIAKKTGWVNSADTSFYFRKANQVETPVPDIPAGYFRDRTCIRFTSATAGATVHYTLDGGRPDTSSRVKANGDSICLDATRVIRVLGRRVGMQESDTASHVYTRMQQAAMPTVDKPDSTWFRDSLCFRFSAATPGSHIHYTLDGGNPDTAETHVHDGDSLCVDRSVTVRLMAAHANYISSAVNTYRYFRMPTVAAPVSDRADSTWFRDTLCLVLSTATPGAAIHYTLDGGLPDPSSPVAPAGGLCVDRTVRLRAMAVLRDWVNSPVSSYVYPRMDTLARPSANPPDSTRFSGTLCVRFTTNADGATLRYSLDGSDPGGSALTLPMSDSLCLDSTVTLRAIAEKANWIPSPPGSFTYLLTPRVERPTASRGDSSFFPDTLCVRFATATDSATLVYLLGPGRADTSSLVILPGQDLCVERSVVVRVAAIRPGWLPSEERVLRFFKMDTAAVPTADPGDSTWFADRQCLRLSTSMPGASIRYTRDGGDPALSGSSLASGDTVCVEDTTTLRALTRKQDWVDSRVAEFRYFRMQKVATPSADRRDSTYFADSLCVRFTTATPGATLRYTLDGSRPDTASPALAGTGSLCVDRSAVLRVIGTLDRWIPSDPVQVRALKMDTVAKPIPDPGDSTYFPQSLCVRWTVATPGAVIRLTTDGSLPDSASRTLASGDTLCLDRSAALRAVGSLLNWKDSPEAIRSYFRMDTVSKPVFDLRDTVFYPSICVAASTPTPGARIRYTLDGGSPDTSNMVKHGGDTICTDRSVHIRAVGERKNSVSSQEAVLRLDKMPQVGPLVSSIGDSAVFARRICFTLASATDSVLIRYTLDGGAPLADTLSMAGGDTLCVDRSTRVVAVGTRPLWRNSPEIRISLEVDNEGPRLVKAEKIPYDIRNISVTGDCRGTGQDTLKVVFSEPLFPKSRPPRWDRLLVFFPSCDSSEVLPVFPAGDPMLSGDGLTATILLDNASQDEKPRLGNCLSLDWRPEEFPDRVGNLPERHGVRIEGRENAVRISQIRAYPPVVGLDNAHATGAKCTDERVHVNTWIPPVGFDSESGTIDPEGIRNCRAGTREPSGGSTAIPPCLSIVEVVSDGPYVADITIFDHLGNIVQGTRQQFGACGELDNLDRSAAGKKRSYLVWNGRGRDGARVGNGAFVWRISFHAEKSGRRGIQTVLLRTGYLRNGTCAE